MDQNIIASQNLHEYLGFHDGKTEVSILVKVV